MIATQSMGKTLSDTNKPIRKVGEHMETKHNVISSRTKTFIKRERLRREMMRTKPGETICLQSDEIDLLLAWVKELEQTVKAREERMRGYGIKVSETENC